jgi:uncharacterized surface protein with fasciclin (FAS1) repeats
MKKASMFRLSILAIASLFLVTASCSDDEPNTPPAPTVTELVVNDPNFSILEAAVVKAGLADALSTTNPITVFAPNNAAFNASGITESVIASLPVATVDSILKYHVLGAFVPSSSVPASDAVTTLLGTRLFASRNTNGVFVNGLRVSPADIEARNGVVHVIERVLIPPTQTIAGIATADTSFSILLAAVVRLGLAPTLSGPGKFTVFAPTNAAFRAAGITDVNAVPLATLDAVVKYHVLTTNVFASDLTSGARVPSLQGGNVEVNVSPARVKIATSTQPFSNIAAANITATNGVIHVIDRVMLP